MNILEIQRIKLGSANENTNNANMFMAEFKDSSSANPLSHRSRIFFDTLVEISIDKSRGRIHIHDIRSIIPGSGAGSRALSELTRLADKHRVDLEGYAFAYSDSGGYITSHRDLARWYKKHGFSVGAREDDGGYPVVYTHKSVIDEDVMQNAPVGDYPRLYHLTDYRGFSFSIEHNQLSELRQRGISTTYDSNLNYIGGRDHYHFKFVLDGKQLLADYPANYYRSFAQVVGSKEMHEYAEKEVRIDTDTISPLDKYLVSVIILVKIMSRSFLQWMFYEINGGKTLFDVSRSSAPQGIYSLKKMIVGMNKPIYVLEGNTVRTLNTEEQRFLKACYQLASKKIDFEQALFELTKEFEIFGHSGKLIRHDAVVRSQHVDRIETTINQLLTGMPVEKLDAREIRSTVKSMIELLGYDNDTVKNLMKKLESAGMIDPWVPPVAWLSIFKNLILADWRDFEEDLKHFSSDIEKERRFRSEYPGSLSRTHVKSVLTGV